MLGPKVISCGSQPRKRAALRLGPLEDLLDAEAGRVAGAEVGARLAQRPRDRVADLVGHLRAAGGVQERETALQRGEPGAHVADDPGSR